MNAKTISAIEQQRRVKRAHNIARLRAVDHLRRTDPATWELLVEEARIEVGLKPIPQGGHKTRRYEP